MLYILILVSLTLTLTESHRSWRKQKLLLQLPHKVVNGFEWNLMYWWDLLCISYSWQLGGVYRPEIWLVPPPHPPTWLEVASVCVEGQGTSVSCPPIWADCSSSNIHQGHQGTVPSCEGQRCLPEGQPWWLACPGLLPGGVLRWRSGPAPVQILGFLSQLGEIQPQTLATARTLEHDLWHHAMVCLSAPPPSPPSHTVPAAAFALCKVCWPFNTEWRQLYLPSFVKKTLPLKTYLIDRFLSNLVWK